MERPRRRNAPARRRWRSRLVGLAGLIVAAAAAGWPGASIGSSLTDQGTQPLSLSHPLLSPGACARCHGDFELASNHEPWPTWAGSLMANASRDPLFWAALDVANRDLPGVGDFCLRCHMPHGWLAGRSEPPGGSVDGCGMEGKIDEVDNDFEGVTCHLCHRMMVNSSPPAGERPVYHENGQFWIDDSNCGGAGEPCRRGPYAYPADGPLAPPHAWAHSPYHEDSDNCGNCHNVTHPAATLIAGGVDTGIPFPIERTFKEWQQSVFAAPGPSQATCQTCHMPDLASSPAYACDDRINDHPRDLPTHRFVGGNAWIPEVLRQEYPNLGRGPSFAATRDWAIAMLQAAASPTIVVPASVTEGDDLSVAVTVTNLSGHKLPTGYPEGRRMWLHVQARDGLGALLWESGAYDASSGVLEEDAQIKIYHAEPGIWNAGTGECEIRDGLGRPQFHFVLNNCFQVDNRIPPEGFTGGSDPETQPVNYLYPETSPGSGVLVNYDVTNYSIPIPLGTISPVTVTATLRYQTTTKEYVEFLRDQALENSFPADCIERSSGFPSRSRGEILYEMWTRHGRSAPVDMTSASASSNVSPVPADCSDGTDNDGDGLVDYPHDPDCSTPEDDLEAPDADGDGVLDASDGCTEVPNAAQADTDGDRIGNACDCDFDQDQACNIDDFILFLPDFASGADSGIGSDMNGSGAVNIDDFILFLPGFAAGEPGPSGLVSP